MRFVFYLPIAFTSLILGIISVSIWRYEDFKPVQTRLIEVEKSKKYEIFLNPIKVRNSDQSKWNVNNGYLNLYDAVILDTQNILTLHLQDGFRISHDGGQSWQKLYNETGGLPGATGGFRLSSLDFIDPIHGWAGGSCLIKTVDGGISWQNVKIPEWIDNMEIKFLNENTGYIAGRGGSCDRGTGECNLWLSVYKTINGGRTWKRVLKTHDGDTPWQIFAVNEDITMVTFGGGWLYRTEDGGKSWKSVLSGLSQRVMSISRSPNGRLWIFGRCSILRSDDLGVTWIKAAGFPDDVIHHEWWSAAFNETGVGIAVAEDAAIAITYDSGDSWKRVLSNLHFNNKIPVSDCPLDEQLRSVMIRGNKGIIQGSQRDYLFEIPGSAIE